MRWILCGKGTAGSRCLEHLVAQGDDVLAIATHGDPGSDGWQRSFLATARALGVPVERPRRINAPDSIARLVGYDADALLSIQYDQILKRPLFEAIDRPCLNFHFALLPRHRGVAPIGWAVRSGDAAAGVTLHHMLVEIDAGDVIAQKAVPIDGDSTAREVYDRVSDACLELFRESYPFAPETLAKRLVQEERNASYHRAGDFDFSQREVDWSQPAPVLHAWIRAMIFPPLQHPRTHGQGRPFEIGRLASHIGAPDPAAMPGTVVARDASGIGVAAGDGVLWIRALHDADGNDALREIAVGERLGPAGEATS